MIEIRNLSVAYRRMTSGGMELRAEAVKNVSLTVERGRLYALAGESGSGKSTVIMAIPGLLPGGTLVSGQILLDGVNLAAMKDLIKSGGEESPSFPRGP